MRILLVTQYVWPESFFINELLKTLGEAGHEITVLTGKPNYPQGEVYEGYTIRGCLTETFSPNVRILRVPLYPRKQGGARALIRNYLSFVINGLRYFNGLIKGKSFDVILAVGFSPILSVIPAIWLKWRLKLPLVVWVQDLWPESLEATGFVKNRFLLSIVGFVVRNIYAASDRILMQSEAFRLPLSQYADPKKLFYYPNCWKSPVSDIDVVLPDALDKVLTTQRCLVFAGNLGKGQSLDTLLQAAAMLKTLKDFCLVFVGGGSEFLWLQTEIKKRSLENVFLGERLAPFFMPKVFEKAKGLLVSLNATPIFAWTIPSKIQAYLSAGKPIIASLNGEGARIIEVAKAGFTSKAEDVNGLVRAITTLYQLEDTACLSLGRQGREYFEAHFEITTQAHRLVRELTATIKRQERRLCKKES